MLCLNLTFLFWSRHRLLPAHLLRRIPPLRVYLDPVSSKGHACYKLDHLMASMSQMSSKTRTFSTGVHLLVVSFQATFNLICWVWFVFNAWLFDFSIDAYRSTRIKTESERPHVKQVIVRKEDVSQRMETSGSSSHINIKQKIKVCLKMFWMSMSKIYLFIIMLWALSNKNNAFYLKQWVMYALYLTLYIYAFCQQFYQVT